MVTWIEVMVGAGPEFEPATRAFLTGFQQVPLDTRVAEAAVAIRRSRRIRLLDAIIAASAKTIGAVLVTRNTKEFDEREPDVRVPYRR